MHGRRQPSPSPLRVRTESNKEASTNNANLASVYGGYAGANYSSPYSSRHQHPNATSPGFPLSSSPYASPKAVQGGVIGRNESHTPTSALPATRLTKAHSIPSASPKGAYAHGHIASTGGMVPSPGHGSMASQGVPGFAQPTFSANVVMNRRNSLSSTAPPGSLASISKLAESAAGGGVAALLGGAGSHTAGSSTIHTATARLTTPLGSTLPPSSSRPGTATLHIGARPSTATNGSVSATTRNAQTPALPGLSLSVGSAQSMGCRGYQEDYRHIVDASATPVLTPGFQNILLGAAVYDGHGGKRVAQWLSSQYLLLNKAMEALQGHIAAGNSPERAEHVLNEVFCACGSQAVAARMNAGSCASIAVVCHLGGIPWVVGANVGDSRTVVVGWEDEGVGRLEVVAISIDHKLGPPKLSEETRRVQAAGGAVLQLFGTWRIEGSLAVARAIGDYEFSRYVSYHPTVMTKQLNHKDKWIIIGSDGLWDVMTNEEVAMYCKTNHHLSAAKLSDALVKEATKNRSSGDNTTVVAIRVHYAPK